MRRVFADTHFYLAILSRRDRDHRRAAQVFAEGQFTEIVTTYGVMLEVADGMCGIHERERCASFIDQLRVSSNVRMVTLSDELVRRGLDLYRSRRDKEWSLTDCISFVVMADEGLAEALTGDRHFEQAGFTALLAGATK